MAKRAIQVISSLVIFFALWLALLFHGKLLPDIYVHPVFDEVIPTVKKMYSINAQTLVVTLFKIPLWLLVTFGSYSLANIGWALFTFGDCPEAHLSLIKEIQNAKMELRSKSVSID